MQVLTTIDTGQPTEGWLRIRTVDPDGEIVLPLAAVKTLAGTIHRMLPTLEVMYRDNHRDENP